MAATYDTVVLDIEGTTTPITFVHETMFPYITSNIDEFLATHWTDPTVRAHVQSIAEQANKDVADGLAQAIAIDLAADSQEDIRQKVLANVSWQMRADRKIGPLKGLQGYMWKFAFESGALVSVIYDDAFMAIRRWVEAGKNVYIYSSGSVEAQKLLFGHSDHGNMLGLFSGYYDTKIGAKVEPESYSRIVKDIGVEPSRVLFISDSIKEIQAADQAGLQTVVSVRPGNAPIAEDCGFRTATNFLDIA
ncbi:enolase-phosphatase E1 [Linderina pennispora]|nr:enolase-phosphatase E1 [Linderina pennispora]